MKTSPGDSIVKKNERHELIKKIIKADKLETQSELVDALRGRGVECTQATVSRDIKDLKLTKFQSDDGKYYYSDPGGGDQPVVNKLLDAFANGFIKADYSGNIVVLKTVVGMAPACAYAIDAFEWQEVVGTIAGEDTIMVVTKSTAASRKFVVKLESLYTRGNA